jgi:hypothetical protein
MSYTPPTGGTFDAKVLSTPKFGDLTLDGSEFSNAGTQLLLSKDQLASWDKPGPFPEKATNLNFQINGSYYTFHPSNILEKGFVADGKQWYNTRTLKNLDKVYEEGQPISLKGVGWYDDFLKKNDLSTEGILMPAGFTNAYLGQFGDWRIQDVGNEKDNIRWNEITGIGKVGDQYVYTVNASPVDGTSAYGYYDASGSGYGEWAKEKGGLLGKLSRAIASVPFGAEALGLATGNPMVYAAASGLRGGATGQDPLKVGLQTGATILAADLASDAFGGQTQPSSVGGTPGVSEVYPVNMGYTAPGTPIAPIDIATAIPAGQLAFPGVEIGANSTPVPGSFKASLPEFGVNLPAGATAVPGSFAAALPSLLSPSAAASAMSVSDVLRGARLASNVNSLLGGGGDVGTPQRQELGQMQASGVDVLQLPQFSAGVPNIAGLLATRQYPRTTFDLYTGLPSLLG